MGKIIAAVVGFVAGLVVGMLVSRRKPSASGSRSEPRRREVEEEGQGGPGIEMYVGNLAYNLDDKDIEKVFAEHGDVVSARIIKNRVTGKSKGYGFVAMATKADAQAVIKALNGADVKGRKIVVSEARSKGRDDEE